MPGLSGDPRTLGRRIAQARDEAGLTQADLAEQVGLNRTAVVRIESGDRKVSSSELVRLGAALNRPIDWFVVESPPAVVSRRSDPAVGGRSILLDRRIERLSRDIAFLEGDGILPSRVAQHIELPSTAGETESAAEQARQWMGLSSEPVLDLQRKVEDLGLLAFSLDFGDEVADGSYVALSGWGVALINGSVEPGRRRFNLAHELGHHLFADEYAPEILVGDADDTERLINGFAVHLLLPRRGVTEVWESISEPRLAAVAIAVRYRASWSAVCGQLGNLNLIDGDLYSTLIADLPTRADHMELGEEWVAEMDPPSVPPQYARRVVSAYRTGRLTAARTVELLCGTVREEELPERRAVPLEGLRREFDLLP